MDQRAYQASPPEWYRSSQFLISLSAQRPSAVLKNLKAHPKYNPSPNLTNNSLKYLKLAPITSFPELPPSITPKLSLPKLSIPKISVLTQENNSVPISRRVSRCAFYSQKGESGGLPKEHNQDATLLLPKVNNIPYQFLFGVFDGHGLYGHSISSLIKSRIKSTTSALKQSTKSSDLTDFLIYTIKLTSQTVLTSAINTKDSGSTLCLVLISSNTLVCANVGDSRCVIASKAEKENWDVQAVSKDHKPSDPDEAARVVNLGGIIDENPHSGVKGDILRVWSSNPKAPGLSMTRSIGDRRLKKVGVSSEPDIFVRKLTDHDKILIVGSDGLWDMVEQKEAAEIVDETLKSGGHAKSACQALVEKATMRWRAKGEGVDDISVIIVLLNSKA